MTSFLRRDLLVLFIASVILGTLAARTISFAADVYFRETITGLVGEYGEYDLLMQLREENKIEALAELNRILMSEFPGAEYKEGPALVQKVNLFIALPEEYKSRDLYENIEKRFSTIPGGVGISIITEPRLIIRGLPPGLLDDLTDKFEELAGVSFVYRNGSSIGIVVKDSRRLQAISDAVERELGQAKLLEISFAKGLEPSNPKLTAERISRRLKEQAGVEAEYVSLDKGSDDFSRLLSVMREMQSFLQAYRTKIFVKTDLQLENGTKLALPIKEYPVLAAGDALTGQAVAQIEYLKRSGLYQAVLVQGDSTNLIEGTAHILTDAVIGEPVGTVTWHNPRSELVTAASDAARVVTDVPELSVLSRRISAESVQLFDRYEKNQPLLRRTLNNMAAAEIILANSADKLQLLAGEETRSRLDASINSLDRLIKSLRFVSWFSSDASLTMENIRDVQHKIIAVRDVLSSADALGEEAQRAGQILNTMQTDIEAFNSLLGSMRRDEIEANIKAVEKAVGSLDEAKSAAVIEALQLLQGNLPLLRDDDIASSVNVIDKLLSGQTVPDKRLQFKISRAVDKEALRPLVAQALNNSNFNLFEAELGIIEPNVYAQAFQILNEVHSVLAALTAVAVTLVFLALDHTAVAAAIKWRYPAGQLFFFSLGSLYSAAAGTLLLTSIYWLAGAAIPYVPLSVVAFCGAVLGILFGMTAEKFSPLNKDELLAAESLGLDFTAVMREIVIPAARPGLLTRLNRLRQKFK